MKRIFTFLFILLFGINSHAQTEAVKAFSATRFQNSVLVEWTIRASYQCSDVEIYHGFDSLNLQHIYTYFGVCGGENIDRSYNFAHTNPIKYQQEYYRMKVGHNEFSEIFVLENPLIQGFSIFPLPVSDLSIFQFENPNEISHTLEIFDLQGKKIKSISNIRSTSIELNKADFKSGLYFFRLYDREQNTIEGKFLVR